MSLTGKQATQCHRAGLALDQQLGFLVRFQTTASLTIQAARTPTCTELHRLCRVCLEPGHRKQVPHIWASLRRHQHERRAISTRVALKGCLYLDSSSAYHQ